MSDRLVARRDLLAGAGVAIVGGLAGCLDVGGQAGPTGEGDTIEVLVENGTRDRQQVGVRVEDDAGEALVSRVYELEPGHLDSTAGIDTRPAEITAFTPTGSAVTWAYDPDAEYGCEGVDIGISLVADGSIETWYAC